MITEKIIKWIYFYQEKFGQKPELIPISAPEMMEIISDYSPPARPGENGRHQIYGVDTELSPWAEMSRQRILEIGVERLSTQQTIDKHQFAIREHKDEFTGRLVRTLIANILTDVTHLDVSFDWDRLAWLKRRVKWIGRKWPIKRKEVRIEGKVLYPYLKIQAPADTHKVRFVLMT